MQRAFDWSRGPQITSLPNSEIMKDLAEIGVSKISFWEFRECAAE